MKTKKLKVNNALLWCGILAAVTYVGLWLGQALFRQGYDVTSHDLSLLSNGSFGWVQITNFLLTGALVIATAFGWRQALKGGKGRTWVPLMIGLYGLGLICAGIFVADPMNGFPSGTPVGPPVNPSVGGFMHIISGAFGFAGFIAACFIMAKRFSADRLKNWKILSLITGIIFLVAFMGIAGSAQQTGGVLVAMTLGFSGAVVLAWTWLALVSYKLMKKPANGALFRP